MKRILILAFLSIMAMTTNAQCSSPCNKLPITKVIDKGGIKQTVTFIDCNGIITITGINISNSAGGSITLTGLEIQNLLPALFAAYPSCNIIQLPATCYSGSLVNSSQTGCTGLPIKVMQITWCNTGCCTFDRSCLDPTGQGMNIEDLDPNLNNCPTGCFPICYN